MTFTEVPIPADMLEEANGSGGSARAVAKYDENLMESASWSVLAEEIMSTLVNHQ